MGLEAGAMVQITDFQDIHQGERVILVGNGYTLQPSDLDAIWKARIDTIAMNGIAGIYHCTAWRPRYYVCVSTAINDSDCEPVFRTAAALAECSFVWESYADAWKDLPRVIPIPVICTGDDYPESDWNDDLADGICKWGTSMNAAAQIAAWIGYDTIYFIGMPGYYTGQAAHFDNYPDEGQTYSHENNAAHIRAHEYIARNLEMRGIAAYNLSRETVITAYPRMKLEDIL